MISKLLDFELYWLLALAPIVLLPHLWSPTHLRLAIAGLLLFWLLRLILNLGTSWRRESWTRINADERGQHPSSFIPHPSKGWTRMNTDERGWHPSSFIPHPLTVAIGTLLCCLPMSLLIAIDSTLAWQGAGYLLFGITLATAAIHHHPLQRDPIWLAYPLILFGCGLAVLSLLLYGGQRGLPTEFISRAIPLAQQLDSGINANVLAGALALILPLALAIAIESLFRNSVSEKPSFFLKTRFLHSGSTEPRLFNKSAPDANVWIISSTACLSTLILSSGLLLTGSRGGYAAAVVGIMVVCGLSWPRLGRLLLILSIISISIVGIGLTYSEPLNLYARDFSPILFEGWLDRRAIWERVWLALQDFPLTGIGMAQFGVMIPEFYPYFHRFNPDIPHAHNLWLQISMDLGLLGLVSYLAIQINLGRMLYSTYQNLKGWNRSLAVGLWGAFSVVIIHGLVDAVSWGTKLSFLTWLVVALGVLLFGKLA